MKKLFFIAVAAATMVACSQEELSLNDNNAVKSNDPAVKFDVYAQRGLTRGGGYVGDLNNYNIGEAGFGVFAYYTAGEQYDANAKPNFMYNQKVTCEASPATPGTLWKYEPVKYWPNEFGDAAVSDELDYVTFFAYAPWTAVEPTTGEIIPAEGKDVDHEQNYNIISVNKNSATGDPIVKYVVDTDPATSVDLLWGVVAENANDVYSAINSQLDTEAGKPVSAVNSGSNKVTLTPGHPFMNLLKPNDPVNDRLMFNLKHALAKVRIDIDYVADNYTPIEGTYDMAADTIAWHAEVNADGDTIYTKGEAYTSEVINAEQTRIFVRSFKIGGFAMKGALNLNNSEVDPGKPAWKDFDGVKELTFEDVTFFDGLKDGKEGTTNNIQKNETPNGLDSTLIENYAEVKENKFDDNKNPGVTNEPVLLFGGDVEENGGYFYVIPRDGGENVDVEIVYDVETIDSALAATISDGLTHGSSIENQIRKEAIFGDKVDFEPGKQYYIQIHIGMTSVKIEASVQPWVENGKTIVNLPNNEDPFVYDETDPLFQLIGATYNYTSFWNGAQAEENTAVVCGFAGGYIAVKVTSGNDEFNNKFFWISADAIANPSAKYPIYRLTDENGKYTLRKVAGVEVTIGAQTDDAKVEVFTDGAYNDDYNPYKDLLSTQTQEEEQP
jgi:hypothetical protein